MNTLVIASHLPGEGFFRSDRYEVRGVECVDDYSYWQGLADVWESDATLINVEHDNEVTDEHVDLLLACDFPLCSWAYQAHWISTHMFEDVWCARNGEDIGTGGLAYFISEGTEWAQQSAIGLVKITPPARIGPLERRMWSQVELSIEAAVQRPWHMHWDPPLNHHHW